MRWALGHVVLTDDVPSRRDYQRTVARLAHVFNVSEGLRVIRVTEQPAFRSQSVTNKQLSLSWNEAARDFTLQRTTVFSGANWEDLSDSDKTNRVPWPLLNSNEFFRPQRQTPGVLPNLRSP